MRLIGGAGSCVLKALGMSRCGHAVSGYAALTRPTKTDGLGAQVASRSG